MIYIVTYIGVCILITSALLALTKHQEHYIEVDDVRSALGLGFTWPLVLSLLAFVVLHYVWSRLRGKP